MLAQYMLLSFVRLSVRRPSVTSRHDEIDWPVHADNIITKVSTLQNRYHAPVLCHMQCRESNARQRWRLPRRNCTPYNGIYSRISYIQFRVGRPGYPTRIGGVNPDIGLARYTRREPGLTTRVYRIYSSCRTPGIPPPESVGETPTLDVHDIHVMNPV